MPHENYIKSLRASRVSERTKGSYIGIFYHDNPARWIPGTGKLVIKWMGLLLYFYTATTRCSSLWKLNLNELSIASS